MKGFFTLYKLRQGKCSDVISIYFAAGCNSCEAESKRISSPYENKPVPITVAGPPVGYSPNTQINTKKMELLTVFCGHWSSNLHRRHLLVALFQIPLAFSVALHPAYMWGRTFEGNLIP